MAGWDCDFNNDDDVLNLNLFARKSFGFLGFPEEKENILRKIVTHIGASCDEYPKYIFTSIEHYNSLTDISCPLYNVTYIRDCVDANRCLTVEHYKFGWKYTDKKEFREFDPCCANFHNGNEACLVCEPTLKAEVPVSTKKSRNRSSFVSETNPTRVKKENKVQNSSVANEVSNHTNMSGLKRSSWEPWEDRTLLDYLILNKAIPFAKGPNIYKKMKSEGILKHRTPESSRVHFRTKILKRIESYDLSPAVLKEFKKIKKQQYPGRFIIEVDKLKVMKNTRRSSAKEP